MNNKIFGILAFALMLGSINAVGWERAGVQVQELGPTLDTGLAVIPLPISSDYAQSCLERYDMHEVFVCSRAFNGYTISGFVPFYPVGSHESVKAGTRSYTTIRA